VVSVCAMWSTLVFEFPAVAGRAVLGLVCAAWMTVNSDSAVKARPVPCHQSTVCALVPLGTASSIPESNARRTSSMWRMLLDLPDQLRHSIPIPFAACFVQLLDILSGLRLFPLQHVVLVVISPNVKSRGRASPTLMFGTVDPRYFQKGTNRRAS
jgi:hypothetical protein